MKNLNGKYVVFGRLGGIKSQSPETKRIISFTINWIHESGVKVKTPPQKAVKDYVLLLNNVVPNSVPFPSGLSELIRKISVKRYGWSIEKVEEI